MSINFLSCLQLRSVRRKVEEAKSALESSKSQGKVIEFIMGLKKSGTLPGVYGRLVCYNLKLLLNSYRCRHVLTFSALQIKIYFLQTV